MDKPYDIMARAFWFSCDAMRAYPNEALEPRAHHAWVQFLRAATSGGAHLEEAEAAASRAHFVTLARGALRELREANYWVRLIGATKLRVGKHRAAVGRIIRANRDCYDDCEEGVSEASA